VIVPDAISAIVEKGEFTPRYYNPGNLFDEVHILMTNDDQVSPDALQKTVGSAQLFLHNHPDPGYGRSFGYHPSFLSFWARRAVKLARRIRPSLIRCYGNWLNGYLAREIKRKVGIPYVVSMHTNPDEEVRGRATTKWEIKYWNTMRKIEKLALHHADIVLPVYKPIIPYLRSMGIEKFKVAYNVLNPEFLRKKDDYGLHNPVRLISVGRHYREKNPENIIRVVEKLPNTHLTLAGDGPLQEYLENVTRDCKVQDRVTFRRAIPNDDLCRELPSFDIFVVHTECWEISKSVLEALLTGLPVVINRRRGEPVPELQGDHVMFVENTPDSYCDALTTLIEDDLFREKLGRRAYHHAQENWAPAKAETKYVEIYKRTMLGSIN
jgi:glycosyltransferase involved in cell wall biosynthesis